MGELGTEVCLHAENLRAVTAVRGKRCVLDWFSRSENVGIVMMSHAFFHVLLKRSILARRQQLHGYQL
jgi:hypothetical protein